MDKLTQKDILKGSTIAFDFVGCKLNRNDIEVMRAHSETLGLRPVNGKEESDVVVVNTCCVTNKAARSSRAMIRKYRKQNPEAFLIVTGCYSQMELDQVRELGVDMIVGNFEKDKFFEYLQQQIPDVAGVSLEQTNLLEAVKLQSRPYLTIQDGCNAYCTYCIIPFARGNPRSIAREKVIEQVNTLAPTYPEMNLVGLNLGKYNDGEGYGLFELLSDLVKIKTLRKLRISSIEPVTLNDELMDLVASSDKICNHLHIPLQGGADWLLEKMGRKYNIQEYVEILETLKKLQPNLCIGADVITGFPGETEEIFEEVYQNIKSMPLDYLHVFTYSPRKGTKAAKMDNQITGDVKKERTAALYKLSQEKMAAFVNERLGTVQSGVIERGISDEGMVKGLTENYIPFKLHDPEGKHILKEVKVRLKSYNGEYAEAELE